jgi:ASC-1-like (ASCH) protein
VEAFASDDKAIKEFDSLKSKFEEFSNIQSIQDKFTNMPLHEYCIKSSYNSACSGNYVSTEMIKHTISRGCRFLDFEVFYMNENNIRMPKVAVSTDSNYTLLDSKNSILLDDVFSTIAANSFSQNSPNSNDPIFINLRIKSRDADVYSSIAKSIDANLKTVAYTGDITKNTKLQDVMKKVVIVIDKTIRYDYKDYATCKAGATTSCYDISNYTNLESGSEYLNKYHYTDILNHANTPAIIKDDNIRTTATHMKMAVPDVISNSTNPVAKEFIVKHGCQNILCQFNIVDDNLKAYEEFFNSMNGGVVPLSVALPYFSKK